MYVGKVKGKEAKRRNKVWFVRDRADGVIQYFDNLEGDDGAKAFAEDYNSNKRRRSHNIAPTNKAQKKWIVRDLIRSYMHSDEYRLQDNLSSVLRKFNLTTYADKTLFDFTPQVADKYVEDRLKKTYVSNGGEVAKDYSPDTIRRDITTIQNAWKWARKNINDLSHLESPWKGIHVPGTGGKRQRGLRKGELELLIKHCTRCRGTNRYYIPLAIYILVDTGMRRQEIFDLTWEDIDFETRRINIKHDKNAWRRPAGDEGRVICLPPLSQFMLIQLALSLKHGGCLSDREKTKIPQEFHPPKGSIFMGFEKTPMTGEGFKQAFEQVRDWAGIVDLEPRKRLTPHSLRAAAEMQFRRVGLIDKEIDVMKNGIKSHYDVLDNFLELIEKKLDTAFLGKPLQELEIEQEELGIPSLESLGPTEKAMRDFLNTVNRAGLSKQFSLRSILARLAEEVS